MLLVLVIYCYIFIFIIVLSHTTFFSVFQEAGTSGVFPSINNPSDPLETGRGAETDRLRHFRPVNTTTKVIPYIVIYYH